MFTRSLTMSVTMRKGMARISDRLNNSIPVYNIGSCGPAKQHQEDADNQNPVTMIRCNLNRFSMLYTSTISTTKTNSPLKASSKPIPASDNAPGPA